MEDKTFELIKEDINNLKNAKFCSISASRLYGYMLKVILSIMVICSTIHMINGLILGRWSVLSVSQFFMHWLSEFTGYAPMSAVIAFFIKSQFILHEQFRSILKSENMIYKLKKNVAIFFFSIFILIDLFIAPSTIGMKNVINGIDISGFDFQCMFMLMPSFLLSAFFIQIEVERSAVGPLLESMAEVYEKISSFNSPNFTNTDKA